jgi:calpain-15
VEWNGDWGDGDFKWTKKFQSELGYSEKADGIFWMSLDDFIYEYANIYICRLFDPTIWKEVDPIEDVWDSDSGGGLPSR